MVASVSCARAAPTEVAAAEVATANGALNGTAPTDIAPLRPPSVPLVTHDPYFSIWSANDKLTDGPTRHWTNREQSLCSLIRIDGETFRLMGDMPANVPALPQTRLEVLPTRTIYSFANAKALVTLTFMTPALPADVDVVSRPITYLTWDVKSNDGAPHAMTIYSDTSAQVAVNDPGQKVEWKRETFGNLTSLRMGTQEQPILKKAGDDQRIDWGYVYSVAPTADARARVASRTAAIEDFTADGVLNGRDDSAVPRAADDNLPVSAFSFDLGKVGAAGASRTSIIGYDDLYSIDFMGQKLRPYWRRNGLDAGGLMRLSASEFDGLRQKCIAFDDQLMADMRARGGEKYARIGALAHRESLAANKIVADSNGQPLMFSKENNSNGSIGTVDVFYPAFPHFLLMSPTLAKATLVPMLEYAASPYWRFPFAPHDLGTYPKATGQVYGDGERGENGQMQVEESGNMLILLGAVSKLDGNTQFADRWWPELSKWADYLAGKGVDLDNQLSTDDFAGHLAHNVNLSAKSIEAIAAYGMMARLHGDVAAADKYDALSKTMAAQWLQTADDGTHFRLAFDKPGSWSQKYNLAWDSILGTDLFPQSALDKEYAFYKTKINRYGLPLDSRESYTKLDWTIWTASLASNRADFEALINPVYDFINDTPDRNPLTDFYRTLEPQRINFSARPVIGGVFLPMLNDAKTWNKWEKLDSDKATGWAKMPLRPVTQTYVANSQDEAHTWRYTTDKPADDWFKSSFNDAAWKSGPGGFGTIGSASRTRWTSGDIWIRRSFELPAGPIPANLQLSIFHDEDAEIYINGVLAAKVGGFNGKYEPEEIAAAARATLKPGENVIAIHCHQTGGGQYIDAGLVSVTPAQ